MEGGVGRFWARKRGELAEKETKHEQKRENCVYNEAAPFVRLIKWIMGAFNTRLRFTPATLSWLQYVVEQILISVLMAAGKTVEDTTVGVRGGGARATLSYRDLAAVLDTLKIFGCMQVLENSASMRLAGKGDDSSDDESGGDDGSSKNKSKSKTEKPTAKAKGKPKAKASSKTSAPKRSKPKGRAKATHNAFDDKDKSSKYSKYKDKKDKSLG